MLNRPSSTAVLVSRGIATIAATPELAPLVPPKAAELTRAILERESVSSRLAVSLLRHAPFRSLVYAISNRVVRGIFLHFALRKRHIESRVRDSLAQGFTRVVILGAGLDTLAVRLAPEFPGVRFLEIDHPASQASKRRLLPREAEASPNLHFCPLDLALPGITVSDCPDWDAARQTIFVAEGLLMYLPVAAVRKLFADLVAASPRSVIVFTAMTLQAGGRPGFHVSSPLADRWLAFRHEPFEWGIRPEDLPAFLAPLGLVLLHHADADSLRCKNPELARDLPLSEGESIYVAETHAD